MANEEERLIVLLEAKIDQFEKNLARANSTANRSFSQIEQRAKKSADNIGAQLAKAGQSVAGMFGSNLLGAAGFTGLGATAIVTSLVKLNSELARIPGLAREAGISTDRLQSIKFAVNVRGLDDSEFVAGMRQSLALLDEA